MDISPIAEGGAGTAAIMFGTYVYKLFRANMRSKREGEKRDDKYVDDCERRYASLSAEIQSMRVSYETNTVAALVESTRAMTTAAEVQREGNTVQRDQTRVLSRVCTALEAVTGTNPNDRTPTGSPIPRHMPAPPIG